MPGVCGVLQSRSFERTIRIGNAFFLRNKDAVENRFRAEVVQDSPLQVETVVHRMVDWTVDRNLRLWRAVFSELDAHTARLRSSGALAPHGDTEFNYNREEPVMKRSPGGGIKDEKPIAIDAVGVDFVLPVR